MIAYAYACAATVLVILCSQLDSVYADCRYEGARYSEGSLVPTAEPCLRCTCSRGTLLCYLRVCPEVPDPPPAGCVILHRYRTCCPELVCTDLPLGGNRIEARLEPDLPEIPYNHSTIGNGCIHNGTVYGSGSAMQTSSLCEYCYCINGRQHCVKPRCLLPVEGCKALYAPHSCCPTHYKCNGGRRTLSTTTTAAAPLPTEDTGGGCRISGLRYPEGGKILGVGHSPCDNCYCMRGVVRCVPLSCAPPLLGCTPVVPQGECCAASYNCSGVIEVKPTLNYGHYPVVSKEYAKLRKEVHQIRSKTNQETLTSVESKHPHYIIAESPHTTTNHKFASKPSTPYYFTSTTEPVASTDVPTSRQFMATTRQLPGKYETSNPESSSKYSRISLTTTRVSSNLDESNKMRPVFKPSKLVGKTVLTTESVLSPVYNPNEHRKMSSQDYLSPLTTSNDGLTYTSQITKRKYDTSTPKVLKYSNYVDIDFENEFYLDGRNNRRIEDQINQESKLNEATSATSTVETSTVQETTESTYPTETTSITTTTDELFTSEATTTEDVSTTEGSTDNPVTLTTILTPLVDLNSDINDHSTTITNLEESNSTTSPPESSTTNETNSKSSINITGTEIIGNNTECTQEISFAPAENISRFENRIDDTLEIDTTTNEPTTTQEPDITSTFYPTTIDDLDISSKADTNVSATQNPFKKISPEIEAILNITKTINKKDEDYEYDYNEPSLPPSLPNLKIIPFVAADAVVEEKQSATVPYPTAYPNHPQDRGTDDPLFGYTLNLFSPPIETEGGFVPRDPPLLNNFYETGYHTTGIVDITAETASPSATNPPKSDNCVVEGREFHHGELTSELGACSMCLCLFGDIVCQPPKCPPLPNGCRRTQPSSNPPICCGHVVCNGDGESPTVVLDRIDVTINPQENIAAERIGTPDPFRDVIRTEPAPDLQSLIGDMPYLVRQTSTLKPTTHMTSYKASTPTTEPHYTSQKHYTSSELPLETKNEEDNSFSLDSVFKLLFSDENDYHSVKTSSSASTLKHTTPQTVTAHAQTTQSKYRTTPTAGSSNSWYLSTKTQTDMPNRNSIERPSSVGLLKLAGCNIYGRMYRVGRIISELSGPCLECMCTEVGVQCKPLKC